MPWLVVLLLVLLLSGCGGRQVVEVEEMPSQTTTAPAPAVRESSGRGADLKTVQELASRNAVNPEEAIRVSDQLLQEEIAPVLDEQTLTNLEKILMAALPNTAKDKQSIIQRNLGIVNFHNKKYNKARQALQYSNETNPRDPRTHYYLACLFNHQAKIYQAKGEKVKAQRHQKRAQIELDTARKLAPNNQLYRKGLPFSGE
jgi:tetratricopeptide (TPR) repeat protein